MPSGGAGIQRRSDDLPQLGLFRAKLGGECDACSACDNLMHYKIVDSSSETGSGPLRGFGK